MSTRRFRDDAFRRKVAGTNPRTWVWRPGFWTGQPAFIATLVVSLVGLAALAPFTYRGAEAVFSLAVQAIAVWGAVIAARALAAADVDLALLREMDARGSDYLRDLEAKGGGQVDLERLQRTLVPFNPADPAPGPIRLFQQICKEARDRRFESAGVLVQPYRDEATEEVFRLQNLQKIALWLGILGTFVGLLMALRQSGGQTDGGDLMKLVDQMYGGLFVAFTASVAGLEVAIILSFLLIPLRKRQETCFTQMESVVVTLLSAARHAINRDSVMAEFSAVTTALRGVNDRLYEQTRALREQNGRIDAGMERLAGARAEFDQFLKEASEAEHAFITHVSELFEAASFKDLAKAFRDGARDAGQQLSRRLDAAAERNATQMETFNASVQGLSTAVQAQSEGLAASVQRLQEQVTAADARNAESIRKAFDRLAAELAQRRGERVITDAMFETLAARLTELNRSVGRLAPGRPGMRDLLRSIAPRWWSSRSRYSA
jgi:hypothetical protein